MELNNDIKLLLDTKQLEADKFYLCIYWSKIVAGKRISTQIKKASESIFDGNSFKIINVIHLPDIIFYDYLKENFENEDQYEKLKEKIIDKVITNISIKLEVSEYIYRYFELFLTLEDFE